MANNELIKHKILDSKVLDHEDIFFGKTKILKDKLVISIKNSPFKSLEVSYQGCSEQGFCYPIQKVTII
jgi:thiol:disulfide interchange protein